MEEWYQTEDFFICVRENEGDEDVPVYFAFPKQPEEFWPPTSKSEWAGDSEHKVGGDPGEIKMGEGASTVGGVCGPDDVLGGTGASMGDVRGPAAVSSSGRSGPEESTYAAGGATSDPSGRVASADPDLEGLVDRTAVIDGIDSRAPSAREVGGGGDVGGGEDAEVDESDESSGGVDSDKGSGMTRSRPPALSVGDDAPEGDQASAAAAAAAHAGVAHDAARLGMLSPLKRTNSVCMGRPPGMSVADSEDDDDGVPQEPEARGPYHDSLPKSVPVYKVILDISKQGLGIVMKPTMAGSDLAVVRRFSPNSVAAACGRITPQDILVAVDNEDMTQHDFKGQVNCVKKALQKGRAGDGNITMHFLARAEYLQDCCDRMWAFFGKPREGTKFLEEPERSAKGDGVLAYLDVPWVDRYMIEKDVLGREEEEADRLIKKYSVVWHPDRFAKKYGRRFRVADSETMHDMALSVAQEITLAKVILENDREDTEKRLQAEYEKKARKAEAAGAAPPEPLPTSPRRKLQRKMTARLTKEGYLIKLARSSRSNWRRRWFTMDSHGVVRYFKSKPKTATGGEEKGKMHMLESTRVEVDSVGQFKKPFTFTIVNPSLAGSEGESNELVCAAASAAERDEWVAQINTTIAWNTDTSSSAAGGATTAAPAAPAGAAATPTGKGGGKTPRKKNRFSGIFGGGASLPPLYGET